MTMSWLRPKKQPSDPQAIADRQVRCLRSAIGLALAVHDDDPCRALEIGNAVPPRERWTLVIALASLVVDGAEELAKHEGISPRAYLQRYALAGLNLENG